MPPRYVTISAVLTMTVSGCGAARGGETSSAVNDKARAMEDEIQIAQDDMTTCKQPSDGGDPTLIWRAENWSPYREELMPDDITRIDGTTVPTEADSHVALANYMSGPGYATYVRFVLAIMSCIPWVGSLIGANTATG